MKILEFKNDIEWLAARRGKITGSRLKDIVVKRGTKEKIGYYELIAERLCLGADGEPPMDRGHRLEKEALDLFAKQSGKEVDTSLVMWLRDDNDQIALSPDGIISDAEAAEVKCLSSARHIEAYLTQSVPDDYHFQLLQYFIVNEKLQKLHFVFYDPRFVVEKLQMFVIETTREQLAEEIDVYLDYQRNVLTRVEEVVNSLTF